MKTVTVTGLTLIFEIPDSRAEEDPSYLAEEQVAAINRLILPTMSSDPRIMDGEIDEESVIISG